MYIELRVSLGVDFISACSWKTIGLTKDGICEVYDCGTPRLRVSYKGSFKISCCWFMFRVELCLSLELEILYSYKSPLYLGLIKKFVELKQSISSQSYSILSGDIFGHDYRQFWYWSWLGWLFENHSPEISIFQRDVLCCWEIYTYWDMLACIKTVLQSWQRCFSTKLTWIHLESSLSSNW